mmetsp:Transcript_16431/g.41206  ORF Transcript_16431/g.41206 Transcript_16431/m.41206 type:complete len:562 (-) Transcript_16431:69-1754(-)|eukprot:CAMPEP_0116103160 /NCGR_PEP_ID=MMETSP0327-20121206/13736_1 /TAXON_ID=44447 /ORGANISM="Pseudo-nitzschia delicatissima, Strain B596" /LENGTH=561 /DNA_ID=CAMNT_0003595251 /DNA_START=173 /DNA_END=1858 /DNA_ORIENTATION=-
MVDQKIQDAANIEDDLDDEQLEEYKEMVEDLGTFPDKVKINTLSMVAEDHAESYKNAELLYNIIRESLISTIIHCDRKLPLVYVVDSILKNVKGEFIPIVEKDASNWFPVVYRALPEEKRVKLEKVWNLWNKGSTSVFNKDKWEEMGRCFSEKSSGASNAENDSTISAELSTTGLSLGKDGRLVLVPALRGAMQKILDEIQEEENEMEKVSLERLAAINADLLIQIKENAESSLRTGNNSNSNNESSDAPMSSKTSDLDFLIETRPPEILNRSKTWEKLNTSEGTKDARDIVANLHKLVRESTNIEKRYTQQEAMEMTRALSTVSVTATLLTNTLQEIKDESEKDRIKSKMGSISSGNTNSSMPRSLAPSYFTIDKSLFTNDGIKKLNQAVIGLLYEVGLPFVSSGDGRRFATQLELSKHMDALFKKGQLEKSIATTQERGWYDNNDTWCGGEDKAQESGAAQEDGDVAGPSTGEDDDADPDTFTMPADESRDRCAICGINFKMLFDNEDGIFKYNNCREIEVLNDEAAANDSEDMLVHVTCWRNLGSPELLTAEQIISRF